MEEDIALEVRQTILLGCRDSLTLSTELSLLLELKSISRTIAVFINSWCQALTYFIPRHSIRDALGATSFASTSTLDHHLPLHTFFA